MTRSFSGGEPASRNASDGHRRGLAHGAACRHWRCAGRLDASHPHIYQELADWIEAREYQGGGPTRDVFVDPRPVDGSVVLEIQWPIHVNGSPPTDLSPRPTKMPSGT